MHLRECGYKLNTHTHTQTHTRYKTQVRYKILECTKVQQDYWMAQNLRKILQKSVTEKCKRVLDIWGNREILDEFHSLFHPTCPSSVLLQKKSA